MGHGIVYTYIFECDKVHRDWYISLTGWFLPGCILYFRIHLGFWYRSTYKNDNPTTQKDVINTMFSAENKSFNSK